MTDDRREALEAHGWVQVEAMHMTWNSDAHPDAMVELDEAAGWRCFDAEGMVVGHSRYATPLSEFLSRFGQPGPAQEA